MREERSYRFSGLAKLRPSGDGSAKHVTCKVETKEMSERERDGGRER